MRKINLLLQENVCWKPFCICTRTHTCVHTQTHTQTHTCWQALVVVIRQMTKAMTTTQCHNLVASSNKASTHLGHACSSFAHSVNLKKMAAWRTARTCRPTKKSIKVWTGSEHVSSPAWCKEHFQPARACRHFLSRVLRTPALCKTDAYRVGINRAHTSKIPVSSTRCPVCVEDVQAVTWRYPIYKCP